MKTPLEPVSTYFEELARKERRPGTQDHKQALKLLAAARDGAAEWLVNGFHHHSFYNEFAHQGLCFTVKFDTRDGAMNFSCYEPNWSYTVRPGTQGYAHLADLSLQILNRHQASGLVPKSSPEQSK